MNAAEQRTSRRDPDGTRRRILEAATAHFSTQGLAGARVDAIAKSAMTNERMLYYYFGSKEQLYVAVLESMYAEFADHESKLDLSGYEPIDALQVLARSIWAHLRDSPQWLNLISNENLHEARYLKHSQKLRQTITPVIDMLDSVLRRGFERGQLRDGVNPLDFYVTLVGMGYYIVSNRFTLMAFTGKDYAEAGNHEAISAMQLEMLLAWVRPPMNAAPESSQPFPEGDME